MTDCNMKVTAAGVSQVAIDLKIFELLANEPSKHWSVDELERHTGAQASLLGMFFSRPSQESSSVEKSNQLQIGSCATLP
jgi:hypothetical protein